MGESPVGVNMDKKRGFSPRNTPCLPSFYSCYKTTKKQLTNTRFSPNFLIRTMEMYIILFLALALTARCGFSNDAREAEP